MRHHQRVSSPMPAIMSKKLFVLLPRLRSSQCHQVISLCLCLALMKLRRLAAALGSMSVECRPFLCIQPSQMQHRKISSRNVMNLVPASFQLMLRKRALRFLTSSTSSTLAWKRCLAGCLGLEHLMFVCGPRLKQQPCSVQADADELSQECVFGSIQFETLSGFAMSRLRRFTILMLALLFSRHWPLASWRWIFRSWISLQRRACSTRMSTCWICEIPFLFQSCQPVSYILTNL